MQARIQLLRVNGILPSFSNIEEFHIIRSYSHDLRFLKKQIGLIDGHFFLLNKVTLPNYYQDSQFGSNGFGIKLIALVRSLLGEEKFERYGKKIWLRVISKLPNHSYARRKFHEFARLRNRI